MAGKIRVLIVDDSALMRQMLSELLASDSEIEVLGTAGDPIVARERIKALNPDVITLDIEMPRMDGLSFLEKIMTLRPMPVVMISSLTQNGADATVRALQLGAVDYVAKPQGNLVEGLPQLRAEIAEKVKLAARAQVRPLGTYAPRPMPAPQGYQSSEILIAIGASTGGVEALQHVLSGLPADGPAVVIAQHMPPVFTASFAHRLNSVCAMAVKEARDRERILPGHAYIAPGGLHFEIARSGADYTARLSDDPPVSGHRPSVDVLLKSVARSAGPNAVGVILTGMGSDGADGLLAMRQAGSRTLGQDEATCLIYGMPKAAKEIGATEFESGLGNIANEILRVCYEKSARMMRI